MWNESHAPGHPDIRGQVCRESPHSTTHTHQSLTFSDLAPPATVQPPGSHHQPLPHAVLPCDVQPRTLRSRTCPQSCWHYRHIDWSCFLVHPPLLLLMVAVSVCPKTHTHTVPLRLALCFHQTASHLTSFHLAPASLHHPSSLAHVPGRPCTGTLTSTRQHARSPTVVCVHSLILPSVFTTTTGPGEWTVQPRRLCREMHHSTERIWCRIRSQSGQLCPPTPSFPPA